MKKHMILILTCFMVVGFATVATSLGIKGSISVALDPDFYDKVYFDSVTVEPSTSSSLAVPDGFTHTDSDNDGKVSVGDVMTLTSNTNEKFNVTNVTGTSISMLAQYNIGPANRQTSTNNYVKFSDDSGWDPGDDIDIQQYDGDAKNYVNSYVTYLQQQTGDTTITGTLITTSELNELECDSSTCTNSSNASWLNNGQQWYTRSSYLGLMNVVYAVTPEGNINMVGTDTNSHGIRPVITVNTSGTSGESITISEDRRTFTYTGEGTNPIDFEIVNKSEQYDATATVSCVSTAEITITNNDTSYNIKALSVEEGNVTYSGETTDKSIMCTLDVLPIERTSKEEHKKTIVYFEPNGGSLDITSKEVTYALEYGELPKPSKSGAVFVGWYTDKNYLVRKTSTSAVSKDTEHTLYAKWESKKDSPFLYRVGNENGITDKQLATLLTGYDIPDPKITATALNNDTDVKYENDKFSGLGTMKINIDGADYYIEVVNARNITNIENKSTLEDTVVLLNDMVYPRGFESVHMLNNYVYGNGFTVDFSNFYNETSFETLEYMIKISDATIDNIRLVGPEFTTAYFYKTEASAANDLRGYQSLILTGGNSNILNSYVSGGRAAVRIKGDTFISNTTIEGGNIANIDVDNGILTLENVITINQDRDNLGSGILLDNEVIEASIIIDGLTQYNWVSKEDAQKLDGNIKTLVDSVFNSGEFTGNYINFGILSMSENEKITVTGYIESTTGTVLGQRGKIWAESSDVFIPAPKYESIDYDPTVPTYYMKNIGTTRPNTETYSYYDGEKIIVGISLTNPYTLNLKDIFGLTSGISPKFDKVLVNGVDCENNEYTFTEAGSYKLTYKVLDSGYYSNKGVLTTTDERTYSYEIVVNVIIAGIEKAEVTHTYASNNPKMPIAASSKGEFMVDVPVIKNLKIVDNGITVLDGTTTDLPSGWTAGELEIINSAELHYRVTLTTNKLNASGKNTTLVIDVKYLKKTNAVAETVTIDNVATYVIHGSVRILAVKDGQSGPSIHYTYNGYNGEPVDLGWIDTAYDTDLSPRNGGSSTCLAEGTKITMEDGSKRAVENLKKGDKVLSYDHLTGKIEANDVIIVIKNGRDGEYTKNTFVFDDGTKLVTINEHGIFDLNLNKYVNIDEFNYKEFIGHSFVSIDSNKKIGVKKLVNVISEREIGIKYDIVTDKTLNYIAEDTLSVTHVLVDVINGFEFSDNLLYDADKMEKDIAKYGLYTYDEWDEYCDISVFEQYNIPVMKIGISKGMYTKEYIIGLINKYVLDESIQITN